MQRCEVQPDRRNDERDGDHRSHRSVDDQRRQPLDRQHPDAGLRRDQQCRQRPVRFGRRIDALVLRHRRVDRHVAADVTGRRPRDVRQRCAGGQPLVVAERSVPLDLRDRDRLVRTRLDARRGFAVGQPLVTHVALADDAQPVAVTRHLVRAHHRAIFATDALVVQMPNDPRVGLLLVSLHRTPDQTTGVLTVMTGRRDVGNRCPSLREGRTDTRRPSRREGQRSDPTPCLGLLQSVHCVARHNARLATAAFVEVHLERVLLVGRRRRGRHQSAVILRLGGLVAMPLGKRLDRRQRLLVVQQRPQKIRPVHDRVVARRHRASGRGGGGRRRKRRRHGGGGG